MSTSNQEKRPPLSLAQIQDRLWQLRMELINEVEYALPCYEEGALSPRRILTKLLAELTELEASAFQLVMTGTSPSLPVPEGFASSLDLGSIKPQATPEFLSMPSGYSPDDMELIQGSDWDLEGNSTELPS